MGAGDQDEAVTIDFLGRYGLDPRRFPKEEQRNRKTPDFRVFKDGQLAFFCEVKSTSDSLESVLLQRAAEEGHATAGTSDPNFNRIGEHISKASQQFDSVNPRLDNPNVLIFVNHDRSSGMNDLISTLTGDFFAEGGSRDHIYGNVSDGRIAESKRRIHLYWWIDTFDKETARHFLNNSHCAHAEYLCSTFGIDKKRLHTV
jgi:hypothetical protein